jgi:hypothetical protein
MKLLMKSSTVDEFFQQEDAKYQIPSYQRAYSWYEKQLSQWILDIKKVANSNTSYYLGRVLLEDTGKSLDVIDGQQRLTTILLFMAAALSQFIKLEAITKTNFINFTKKFKIAEADQNYFKSIVTELPTKKDEKINRKFATTLSQQRLLSAYFYFHKELKECKEEDVSNWCHILLQTTLAVITVKDKKSATLMFQLENDRGVTLTNMEKLKAALMYQILIRNEENTSENMHAIAKIFTKIGRLSFSIRETADSILTAHYRAFVTVERNPYRDYTLERLLQYFDPKDTQRYQSGDEENDETDWDESIDSCSKSVSEKIMGFAKSLQVSFNAIADLEKKRVKAYQNSLKFLGITDYAMPFLLIEYHENQYRKSERFTQLVNILANLILRQEYVRAEHGERYTNLKKRSYLGQVLSNFRKSKNVNQLEKEIVKGFEREWRHKNKGKKEALIWSKKPFFTWLCDGYYPARLTKFFLFQYERKELANNQIDLTIDWTIEHISPQSQRDYKKKNDFGGYASNEVEANKIFNDGYIPYIGNLCLLERNINSSAGNGSFLKKAEIYKGSAMKHVKKEVCDLKSGTDEDPLWSTEAIDARGDKIIEFIRETYKPGKLSSNALYSFIE